MIVLKCCLIMCLLPFRLNEALVDEDMLVSIQELLDETNENAVSFDDIYECVLAGDLDEAFSMLMDNLLLQLTDELAENRKLLVGIMVLGIVGAIFTNFSSNFASGFTSENGFYVTYIILVSLLTTSFALASDIASQALVAILDIMKAVIPVFSLAIGSMGGYTSSIALYEALVFGIGVVQWGILNIIFPMINIFVALSLVNQLTKEDKFSKLTGLIKTIYQWLLKSITAFLVGMNMIKSLIAPAYDKARTATIEKSLAAIPGGNTISALSGVMIGSAMLIKNSIGVAAVFVIISAISIPVLKLIVFILVYKLTMSILQPITDKRIIDGINVISDGTVMLLNSLITACVLFILSIAIIAYGTNSIGG